MADLTSSDAASIRATLRPLASLARCEGVAAGPDGALWAASEPGILYRIDPADGAVDAVADVGGFGLGLCLDAAGRIYVCVYDAGTVVRIDPASGETDVYCEGIGAPNFPVFGPDGVLYVSDSGSERLDACDGRVVVVPPGGGEATPLPIPRLAFSNGLALAPDGVLYVLESWRPRIRAVEKGALRTHAELPGTVPDGLALDEEGGILVACFQPNRILRVPPGGGAAEIVLDDWRGLDLLTPTNVAYFGPDRRSVAVASLCGWSLSAFEVPWSGLALHYPELP